MGYVEETGAAQHYRDLASRRSTKAPTASRHSIHRAQGSANRRQDDGGALRRHVRDSGPQLPLAELGQLPIWREAWIPPCRTSARRRWPRPMRPLLLMALQPSCRFVRRHDRRLSCLRACLMTARSRKRTISHSHPCVSARTPAAFAARVRAITLGCEGRGGGVLGAGFDLEGRAPRSRRARPMPPRPPPRSAMAIPPRRFLLRDG